MRYTNKTNLPLPVYRAIAESKYDKGRSDFSVTELLKPHYQAWMERQHLDKVELDLMEGFNLFLGNAIHKYLEDSVPTNDQILVPEERCYMTINGKIVGGKADLYDRAERRLYDYKTVTVAGFKTGSHKPEWEKQLNALAYIWKHNGYKVDSLSVIVFIKDWRPGEAKKDESYPKEQVSEIRISMWPEEQTRTWLEARVNERVDALENGCEQCSEEERWARPDKWALMKDGAKRAVKLFDTEEEAIEARKSYSSAYIEHRPGSSIRCASYCPVRAFCPMGVAESGDE